MRFIHTSDWHLGHELHDQDRRAEHQAFLGWLLALLGREKPHALLIAGDIFHTSNPSATAVRDWYRFLVEVSRLEPSPPQVIVIGGNHDSGPRLDAPRELLEHFRVHVVGNPPRAGLEIDPASMLVEVHDAEQKLVGRVAAVPYLRPADLPGGEDPDRWIEAAREVYASVFRAVPDDDVPLVAMGHAYMVGGQVSELSERKVFGGNLHAFPSDIFPPRVAYAALGHLHRAQKIGGDDRLRYCGSPIPLALDERAYPHQVRIVEIVDGLATSRAEDVPRTVPLPRFPPEGAAPLAEIEEALRAWPDDDPAWIEVCVRDEPGLPDLRAWADELVAKKRARVLRVGREGAGLGGALADGEGPADLSQWQPQDILLRLWNSRHPDAELPTTILADFHELHALALAMENES